MKAAKGPATNHSSFQAVSSSPQLTRLLHSYGQGISLSQALLSNKGNQRIFFDQVGVYGRLGLLHVLSRHQPPLRWFCLHRIFWEAAKAGHLEVLRCLLEQNDSMKVVCEKGQVYFVLQLRGPESSTCKTISYDEKTFFGHLAVAAANGHLQVLHHFQQIGVNLSSTGVSLFDRVAASGKLEVLEWLHAGPYRDIESVGRNNGFDRAAANGHVRVLEWWQNHRGENWSQRAMDRAAAKSLGVVEWLHKNSSIGCTCEAMDLAAENGHLDTVEFLHRHRTEGCSPAAMYRAAGNGHLSVVKWLNSNREEFQPPEEAAGAQARAFQLAARGGHLAVLEWLATNPAVRSLRQGRPPADICFDCFLGAASGGHLATLEWLVGWLRAAPGPAHLRTWVDAALRAGRLPALEWLHARFGLGGRDPAALTAAAGAGHLGAVAFAVARRRGGGGAAAAAALAPEALFPADPTPAFDAAALAGHTAVAAHLHRATGTMGSSPDLLRAAAAGGHLGAVEWLAAHTHRCWPPRFQAYAAAAARRRGEYPVAAFLERRLHGAAAAARHRGGYAWGFRGEGEGEDGGDEEEEEEEEDGASGRIAPAPTAWMHSQQWGRS